MLNTDLHNPNMNPEKRMTLEEFIRNNRGINEGEDLSEEFLTEVYKEIEARELRVGLTVDNVLEGGVLKWDGILTTAKAKTHIPFVSTHNPSSQIPIGPTLQEKDMFTVLSTPAIQSLKRTLVQTYNDSLLVSTLEGFRQMALISVFFEMTELFNDIVSLLLGLGREYVSSDSNDRENESPVPRSLIDNDLKGSLLEGSADHRGLLALHRGLTLVRSCTRHVREAWPELTECLFALRDAKGMERHLSELDDFADSSGKVLPETVFKKRCRRSVEELLHVDSDDEADTGFWESVTSLLGRREQEHSLEEPVITNPDKLHSSSFSDALLSVSHAAQLDTILLHPQTELSLVQQILRALLDARDPTTMRDYDALFEHHAVFALELAARALLSNRNHAAELYPVFLSKLRLIFTCEDCPYLMERGVVTVLRACIHLYDVPEMRPHLLSSLLLLPSLPPTFTLHISSRLGCGLAIILIGCFPNLANDSEWDLFGNLLDMTARYHPGRNFVLDGIASCLEKDNNHIGMRVLAHLLTNFVTGAYDKDDVTLKVSALTCLVTVVDSGNLDLMDNEELWIKISSSFYYVCVSCQERDAAFQSFDSLQQLLLTTKIQAISYEGWLYILQVLSSHQPTPVSNPLRVKTFDLLARVLLIVLPCLTTVKTTATHTQTSPSDERLELVMGALALVVRENLTLGQTYPVFESTVQVVTNLVNVLSSAPDEFGGALGKWCAGVLVRELENVGAAGGLVKPDNTTQETND
mmetsp:Transcript_24482/g.29570  ORF Transcript_24482/g.29570 Transcript_24482/m.29570 type:complete len:753 (+) Transcript_24482:2-2260(+)